MTIERMAPASPMPAAPGRIVLDDLSAIELAEMMPEMLLSLMERRYLADFRPEHWRITARSGDLARSLLREVQMIGRPRQGEEWAKAMPHVLTACHEPGHALVMVVHGDGARHRLFLGGRRIWGMATRSTEDCLDGQASAFKAHLGGLQLGDLLGLDGKGLPEISAFLQTAPALALLTGIPSGRDGRVAFEFQSLDRLVKAVGNGRYTLLVVAEALETWTLDETIDLCRRLKSEVHAYVRRTVSRTVGESTGVTTSSRAGQVEANDPLSSYLPLLLSGVAVFLGVCAAPTLLPAGLAGIGLTAEVAGKLVIPVNAIGSILETRLKRKQAGEMRQQTTTETLSRSESVELLNANAEACEILLQRHIDRLQSGRRGGWWRTAVYVAAESDRALESVTGALRGLCSGDATALDPIRVHRIEPALLREAIQHGQVLNLHPTQAELRHPLGESFDTLGTCMTSEELSVLVNLPHRELPGLPMRNLSEFALSAPAATEDAIELGTLQDALGRDLSPVTITSAALNRHTFITGMTGYGKTTTAMRLLLEAYEKLEVPFLAIEPAKEEYRRLAAEPKLRGKLRVYSIGGDSPLPLRLNPLSPIEGVSLARHIDLLKAVFNASFPTFTGVSYVLEEALLEVYTERGWNLYSSLNDALGKRPSADEVSALTPCLQDLHDKIEDMLKRPRYGAEAHQRMGAALRARLQSLIVGNKGLTLNVHRSIPPRELFAQPTVIELRNLGDDGEKAFVMALLLVLLYEFAERRQLDIHASGHGRLQHLTLVEEAHRLLQAVRSPAGPEVGDPRAKAVAMFTDMLAEMRAYGEGFIVADQIPTKLAPEILKNSSLKIIHRLVAPDDRTAAGSCINLSPEQTRHLINLTPGLAVVHDEHLGEAVLMRVHPTRASGGPAVAAPAHPGVIADVSYLFRNAGCRHCPAPCTFYHRIQQFGPEDRLVEELQPFFDGLLLGGADEAWAAWTRWRGNWRARGASLDRTTGMTYCAAVQAAHRWIELQLAARSHQATGAVATMSPQDRLRREKATRQVASLYAAWLTAEGLDEKNRSRFVAVQADVRTQIAGAPPRERPGCAYCPARCLMLSLVAPQLREVASAIAARATTATSVSTRRDNVARVAEERLPILAACKDDAPFRRMLLYCLVTNATATSEPGHVEDLLADLRGDTAPPARVTPAG